MTEDLDYLKFQREYLFNQLEGEKDENKRKCFEAEIAGIDKKINENDLDYLKVLEKFQRENQLDDDFEDDQKADYFNAKTLEEKIDHSLDQVNEVIKQVEIETIKVKDKNNQIDENLVKTVKIYDEKRKDLEKEKTIRETEYNVINKELEKKEDEINKTKLDAQRGEKDVVITENRIKDYDNLEKRLEKTIDSKTSDSKEKEKEALLLQTEINNLIKDTENKEIEIQSKNVLIETQEEKLKNEEQNKISMESQLAGAKNKRIVAHVAGAISVGILFASWWNPVLAIIAVQGLLAYLSTYLDIDQLISELEKKLDKTNRNLKEYQQFIDQKKLEKENLEKDKSENKNKKEKREKVMIALMAGDDEIKKAILDFKQQLQVNSSELDVKKEALKSKQDNLAELKKKHEILESERNDKKSELDNIQTKIVENNKNAGLSLEKSLDVVQESKKSKAKEEKKKQHEETKRKIKSLNENKINENSNDLKKEEEKIEIETNNNVLSKKS